jgi:hypothetical protein
MKIKIINNNPKTDTDDLNNIISDLVKFSQNRLGFDEIPSIHLDTDKENHKNTLGKTAYYDPATMEIHVYTDGRHPKDMLRSISHELIHHMQNLNGDLTNIGYSGPGYAQKNPKMRELERQAYEEGNMCMRDWEDQRKQQNETIYNINKRVMMSLKNWKNQELNKLIRDKFNIRKKNDVDEKQNKDITPEKK